MPRKRRCNRRYKWTRKVDKPAHSSLNTISSSNVPGPPPSYLPTYTLEHEESRTSMVEEGRRKRKTKTKRNSYVCRLELFKKVSALPGAESELSVHHPILDEDATPLRAIATEQSSRRLDAMHSNQGPKLHSDSSNNSRPIWHCVKFPNIG